MEMQTGSVKPREEVQEPFRRGNATSLDDVSRQEGPGVSEEDGSTSSEADEREEDSEARYQVVGRKNMRESGKLKAVESTRSYAEATTLARPSVAK